MDAEQETLQERIDRLKRVRDALITIIEFIAGELVAAVREQLGVTQDELERMDDD